MTTQTDATHAINLGKGLLLTIREIIPVLGLSEYRIRQIIHAGILPSHRIGEKIYVHRADLEEFGRQIQAREIDWSATIALPPRISDQTIRMTSKRTRHQSAKGAEN